MSATLIGAINKCSSFWSSSCENYLLCDIDKIVITVLQTDNLTKLQLSIVIGYVYCMLPLEYDKGQVKRQVN